MRLKVNGVEIRVVDRIEIELDVAQDGEDLIHGIDVKFRGGPLTVRSIPEQGTAFLFHTQRTLFLRGRDACFSATNEDPCPPRLQPLGTALPWDSDGHGFDARCEDGKAPAVYMEADPQPNPFQPLPDGIAHSSTSELTVKIYRVFYSLQEAQMNGETRHAQVIMKELAGKLSFTILDSEPQSVFDGWEFWIQSTVEPALPPYVRIVPFEPMPTREHL